MTALLKDKTREDEFFHRDWERSRVINTTSTTSYQAMIIPYGLRPISDEPSIYVMQSALKL